MPEMRRRLFSVVVLVACCNVICLMTSCLGQITLKAEQASPTGKYKAELRESDTGALGGWTSSIRVSEVSPNFWTRLLRREGDTVFGGDLKSTHVSFTWKNDNHLQITCSGCDKSKILLQSNAWKDVTISYEMGG